MYISIVEYGVMNYPEGFEGWRFVRFEYLDDDQPFALNECHVWLPPGTDTSKLEDFLNKNPRCESY